MLYARADPFSIKAGKLWILKILHVADWIFGGIRRGLKMKKDSSLREEIESSMTLLGNFYYVHRRAMF